MRRVRLVAGLAVAAACVVAPMAASAAPATPAGPAVPGTPGSSGGEAVPTLPNVPDSPSQPVQPVPTDPVTPPPTEPMPSIRYVVWGCLTQNATSAGAPMRVTWGNGDMRTALDGADTFTVGLDAATSVRSGWPWQRSSYRGGRYGRSGWAGLRAGDFVSAYITAPSGTAAAELPSAGLIVDYGRLGGPRGCSTRR